MLDIGNFTAETFNALQQGVNGFGKAGKNILIAAGVSIVAFAGGKFALAKYNSRKRGDDIKLLEDELEVVSG
jgi:hypothetical protein